MNRPLKSILTLALVCAAPGAIAMNCELKHDWTSTRAAVIELYTSEGCSSCPPADRWLSQLDVSPAVVALAFHVDYWDRLGWPDRFANRAYSQRQSWRARISSSRTVFTPQVVVDGRTRTDWARAEVLPASSHSATFSLAFLAVVDQSIRVAWQIDDRGKAPASAVVSLAVTESNLSSVPTAGENRGAALKHAHVVRAFVSGLKLDTGSARLQLPRDLVLANARLNVIVEDPRDGVPLHAAVLPLSPCSADQPIRAAASAR